MQASTEPGGLFAIAGAKGSYERPRVLAADDQQHVLEALELLLRPQGYEVETARSPALVRDAVATGSYDALLIDLNYTRDTTSGQEGLDLLSEIVALDNSTPVIVMTAWANIELAVEAMRRGARDFIQKPWENERLLTVLRAQVVCAGHCSAPRGLPRRIACCKLRDVPSSLPRPRSCNPSSRP
jgi:FixJ family two-component response regulator